MGGAVSGPGYACLVDLILQRLRDDKAALSAALQLVWWAAMFLLLPWTAFVVPVLGVWYILFVALHIIYPALDGDFRVEEQIMEKFPERLGD